MSASGLDYALEARLGIEVVPLYVVADMADRRTFDAEPTELLDHLLGFLSRLEHDSDRADPLPMLLKHPLPRIVTPEWLDELEVEVSNFGLRPANVEVVGRLAVEFAVVHHHFAVGFKDFP